MTSYEGRAMKKYSYRVFWSDEDQAYIGACAEFPSLSWHEKTQTEALDGIVGLVDEVVADMRSNQEPVPPEES